MNQRFVCSVATSPLRSDASHKAEMVSQLIFGETISIVETIPDWIRIRADYDGYEGWCQPSHFVLIRDPGKSRIRHVLNANWAGKLESKSTGIKIPFGSSLALDSKNYLVWSNPSMRFRGKCFDPSRMKRTKSEIRWCACQFLETPYLWGGKTVFGTDCSGFTQTVFKFFDIPLRRDAWQQADQGQIVENIQESKFGDLAFFKNGSGKIIHVGILMGKHIIHASGKVRIDIIDETGIRNSQTGERTHQLALIKRFL